MAFGKTAASFTITDDAGAAKYLREQLTAALSVSVTVRDQYCLIRQNAPYYENYDENYGVAGRLQGETPAPVIGLSANGFAQVKLNVGTRWVKGRDIGVCLTQAMVNSQLGPAAKKAVDEWWANQTVGPYWADQILNNQSKFNNAINEINAFYLKPLLATLPFFQEWKLV